MAGFTAPRKKMAAKRCKKMQRPCGLAASGGVGSGRSLTPSQRPAKADGRWENAYHPASEMKVPADFLAALESRPKAKQFFETLNKSSRYVIAYRLATAKKPETRQRRFEQFMDMLVREEKPDSGVTKGKKV